jgi:hypothetical protein
MYDVEAADSIHNLSCAAFGIMSLSNECVLTQLATKNTQILCSDLAPHSTDYYEEAGANKKLNVKEPGHGFLPPSQMWRRSQSRGQGW